VSPPTVAARDPTNTAAYRNSFRCTAIAPPTADTVTRLGRTRGLVGGQLHTDSTLTLHVATWRPCRAQWFEVAVFGPYDFFPDLGPRIAAGRAIRDKPLYMSHRDTQITVRSFGHTH
jgi:hypothetical protein